jgi:hypothetical protein
VYSPVCGDPDPARGICLAVPADAAATDVGTTTIMLARSDRAARAAGNLRERI